MDLFEWLRLLRVSNTCCEQEVYVAHVNDGVYSYGGETTTWIASSIRADQSRLIDMPERRSIDINEMVLFV